MCVCVSAVELPDYRPKVLSVAFDGSFRRDGGTLILRRVAENGKTCVGGVWAARCPPIVPSRKTNGSDVRGQRGLTKLREKLRSSG